MAMSEELVVGALVDLDQYAPNRYRANEVTLPKVLKKPKDAKTIDWGFGPLKVSGYLDLDKREIGVDVSVVGISLGKIAGSLDEGVYVDVNLFVAKGSLKFYLKDGNDLWLHVNLSITFDGTYEDDYNIPWV